MILITMLLLGLCLGSFTNALVWRIHQQALPKKKRVAKDADLSIAKGRSMCPDCRHQLAWYDLVPVLSWLQLRGKCRYCKQAISWHYPIVELLTAGLFGVSYVWWPDNLQGVAAWLLFGLWLISLVVFMALAVYDLRWQLLPNKLVFVVTILGALYGFVYVANSTSKLRALLAMFEALISLAGLFYLLFQVSKGKWLGGGDVKLAVSLSLFCANPYATLLLLFCAATLGTVASLPFLATKKLKQSSHIPFGPFLIIALVIVRLFGMSFIVWYQRQFLAV